MRLLFGVPAAYGWLLPSIIAGLVQTALSMIVLLAIVSNFFFPIVTSDLIILLLSIVIISFCSGVSCIYLSMDKIMQLNEDDKAWGLGG